MPVLHLFEAWQMKLVVKSLAVIICALILALGIIRIFDGIHAVFLCFFSIAVLIVFVAVFSKAYKNWPV